MWLCYLRFEDQGQPIIYLIGCAVQANIDEIVRRSKQHGLTATSRFVEHARFYSSRTIYPKHVLPGQWYDDWQWLDEWEIQDSTRHLVLIDRDTSPEPFIYGQDRRRTYLFPRGRVVCCNNLTLTEVQGQVCECLVRTDIGPPSRERPEEYGKEIIHVRVLKRVRDQTPERPLSALLASVW
ncbi:MAG TPA: hypothetical protein VKT82_01780 [Ktedonobacterales bacterium]|nr:hypothetical protein [Ktedonobacterales bacterium]